MRDAYLAFVAHKKRATEVGYCQRNQRVLSYQAMALSQALLLLLCALVGAKYSPSLKFSPNLLFDFDDELDPRVIGGRDALKDEFPWMVSLHYKGKFVCSSFLLTPRILMTAAHCVVFGRKAEDPKDYVGYIGTIDRDGPGTRMEFEEIAAHPRYGSGFECDIALLKLKEPVQVGDGVQTICLPKKGDVYEDTIAQVMGWGVHEKGGRKSSEILQTATEKVPPNTMCRKAYTRFGVTVTRKHVCAGGDQDKGICFGDSGGPLVAMNETKPIAIGVASFGSSEGCAAHNIPAVYTATSMYTDWIMEKAGEESSALCFVEKTSKPSRRTWG